MGHKKVVRIDPLTKAMPFGGVDSHAHLDDEAFDADRERVLERAYNVGIEAIVNIFLDPASYRERKKIFEHNSPNHFPHIFHALGMHPIDGTKFGEKDYEILETELEESERIVAVGEIGLDYYWKDCPKEIQLALFSRQLAIAKKKGKPVIIHCREAEEDCLMVLESQGFSSYPVLWHCFGGNVHLAQRLIRHGWMISVPGTISYPANSASREAIASIPDSQLLIETDCPYLSPNPWRGTRNEPAYTVFTAEVIAAQRHVDVGSLWKMCGENAKRFFGMKDL